MVTADFASDFTSWITDDSIDVCAPPDWETYRGDDGKFEFKVQWSGGSAGIVEPANFTTASLDGSTAVGRTLDACE